MQMISYAAILVFMTSLSQGVPVSPGVSRTPTIFGSFSLKEENVIMTDVQPGAELLTRADRPECAYVPQLGFPCYGLCKNCQYYFFFNSDICNIEGETMIVSMYFCNFESHFCMLALIQI